MKKIAIIMMILSCTMCKQKQQNENVIFVDFDKPEKASLFDYFRTVELIPLETSSDVLVSSISKTVMHQDRYYALDMMQSIIFVFDHTGKFIFKIDKKGVGRGEYFFIDDFNINPFSGTIELLQASGSVNIFDLTGNFIETKRIEYPNFRAVHLFAPIDSNVYVYHPLFETKKIVYFNLDKKKLLHEEFEENREIGRLASNSLYSYKNDWYFFRPIHPFIYKVGIKQLEVAFQFDFGKYTQQGVKATFSEEGSRSRSKYIEEVFAQFPYVIRVVRHNEKYVMAMLAWKDFNTRANIMVNKSIRKSKFITEFTEKVDFEPFIITDEYVLSCCNWVDLEKYVTKDMLEDKQKKILDVLLKSEMELNPILIKYWFK